MAIVHLLRRSLRRLHSLEVRDPVPGELRGWSFDTPPVRPAAYLGLGVSEIAYGAKCGWRQLWLRRRAGVEVASTSAMEAGALAHKAFHYASSGVRRLLARGLEPWEIVDRLSKRPPRDLAGEPWAVGLYRMLVAEWAGEVAGHRLYYGGDGVGVVPWLTEYRVDGSPLGLSRRLRVDAMGESGVVVEVKLGRPQWWHRVALTGYALALEANFESPVDYGILVGVVVNGGPPRLEVDPVYISPDLREDFLRLRDEAVEVLLSDSEPDGRGGC